MVAEHFTRQKFFWWPLRGKDGILAELEKIKTVMSAQVGNEATSKENK